MEGERTSARPCQGTCIAYELNTNPSLVDAQITGVASTAEFQDYLPIAGTFRAHAPA